MATTPYPFVASTVLTASQLNSTFNIPVSTKTANYVLTAADAGTRVNMNAAGATTITVNTSIFSAGDNLQISNIGAGVTTVTAGTATVSSAGPLAISQYGGGTLYFTSASAAIFFPSAGPAASSALTLIYNNTFSGSSVTLSNVFSASYENYKIKISNAVAASGNPLIRFRLGAGTNHIFNLRYFEANSTGTVDSFGTNVNYFQVGQISATAGRISSVDADILSAFLALPTGLTAYSVGYSGTMYRAEGVETASTSFTDLVLSNSGGVSMSGSIQIYGYGL